MFINIRGSFNPPTLAQSWANMAINVNSIIFVEKTGDTCRIGVRDYGNIFIDSCFSDLMKSIEESRREPLWNG